MTLRSAVNNLGEASLKLIPNLIKIENATVNFQIR